MKYVRPFASTSSDSRAIAQVVVRRFAATTNLLVAGRSFAILTSASASSPWWCEVYEALGSLLSGFGAHVRFVNSVDEATADAVVVRPEEADEQSLGHISVVVGVNEAPVVRVNPSQVGMYVNVDEEPDVRQIPPHVQVLDSDGKLLRDPYDPKNDASYAQRRLAWARSFMPVTRATVSDLVATGALKGRHVGLALVLEPKTAVLALLLKEAGATVSVFGHADETRDDVADQLRAAGLAVFAESSATPEREEELARQFLTSGIEFLLDDGSHLIRMAHDETRAPDALTTLKGAAEETTSGIRPLRGFPLRIPVMASNDARSKTLFDNAYATGQSCLLTSLDLVDPQLQGVPLWNQRFVVVGYGDVGMGGAHFARACGALVTVVELDPVRELRARMDGFQTASLLDACANADWVMSATGEHDTITLEALTAMPDACVVTVSGGVTDEVALSEALKAGWTWEDSDDRAVGLLYVPATATDPALPGSAQGNEATHRHITILDKGGCINCTAGEGNAIEIMDMSFAVQVSSLRELLTHENPTHDPLSPGVHSLPEDADNLVARRALDLQWTTEPQPISFAKETHV